MRDGGEIIVAEIRPNIFVTLDGVDGVGKTTVAQLLAARGYIYYKSPSGPFADLRREIDQRALPLERYCFYRLATEYDAQQIRVLLETGSVVCDRYITSTAAYHMALDDRIRGIHDANVLMKPDFAFLLHACPEVRDRRIRARAGGRSDAVFESNSAFLNRVADVFTTLGLHQIDTSDMTPEEVVSLIERVMTR